MTGFQIGYLCFGGSLIVSGLTMIVTYTLSYPWWRDLVGRMMVIYAGTEVAMSAILLLAVVAHVGPHWFRGIWFVLQTLVASCFVFQTRLILVLRRNRISLEKEEHENP